MEKLLFKETQKVNLNWKWMLFIAIYSVLFWAIIDQLKQKDNIESIIALIFSLCLVIFFNIMIMLMKLETEIKDSGISIQYKPFHRKPRFYSFKDISELYCRYYKPIKEYGGYGIQRHFKNGKAFNVSGRNGLQLILLDGNKVLIGTQKPKELEMVIEKIKRH